LQALLQIFAKAPLLGLVKTRLSVDIGEQAACDAYIALLEKTLQLAINYTGVTELYCAPDDRHAFFQACVTRYPLSLCVQCDGDLGDRMLAALQEGLKTHDKVLLIGADCPVLTVDYLNGALAALDDNDVVLGPAEDGGFVLIACRATHAQMFDGVSWGLPSVLANTVFALDRLALTHHLLTPLWDVDDIQDLRRWQTMDSSIEPAVGR